MRLQLGRVFLAIGGGFVACVLPAVMSCSAADEGGRPRNAGGSGAAAGAAGSFAGASGVLAGGGGVAGIAGVAGDPGGASGNAGDPFSAGGAAGGSFAGGAGNVVAGASGGGTGGAGGSPGAGGAAGSTITPPGPVTFPTGTELNGTVTLGKGSYAVSGSFATPGKTPQMTSDCTQTPRSAKWWVTLITEQFSSNMFAHPLGYKATAGGLDMGYPGWPTGAANDFHAGLTRDVAVGISGMSAAAAQVARYSDFSVTARWEGGGKTMEATMSQGLPFAYFKITGGSATVTTGGTVFYNQGGVLGITNAGHSYGVFAPTGSTWTGTGTLTSTLSGKDYLSVALLPDNAQATLDLFKKYAYAFVTKTYALHSYDEPNARVITKFTVETEAKEGTERGTVFALLRHQWLDTVSTLTNYTYQSPRGVMKVVTGPEFVTSMVFNGILPAMPYVGADTATLGGFVNDVGTSVGGGDTYNSGKAMGKAAAATHIAEFVGNTAKRDALVAGLKTRLEDWLTTGGSGQFFYNKPWGTIVGYPASFYSDTRLADHHFHWGYLLQAAAVVARWDPEWAKQENWGAMVELIARDVNTWGDNDPLYGRYGYWEPYEGHGWADGMGFGDGNNQESSSESMNFHAGMIWWGIQTGNKLIRDQALFAYVHETRAIEQYWWDVDHVTFPAAYAHTAVGMVWSNGGAHSTWFSGSENAIHGINFLPITGGHLYIGRRPDYIPENYTEGFSGGWSDLFYEYLAFSDADLAATRYGNGPNPEGGETKAHAYQLIKSLQAVGRLSTKVTADVPTYAVFDKAAVRTYAAYNPDAADKTVTFSDGYKLAVPAKKQVHGTGTAQ
jgi:endoglucanase Acf2